VDAAEVVIGNPQCNRCRAFVDEVIAKRQGKPGSKEVWRQGKLGLLEFFGADTLLSDVNAGMADDFVSFLQAKPIKSRALKPGDKPVKVKTLAPMTVKKRLQFARTVFRTAVRHGLIDRSPFDDVAFKAAAPDRKRFITQDEYQALLAAAPDQNWRSIIALSRLGGLRCPSEVLSLKFEDIDWERNTIRVPSPKTAHHPGQDSRIMPLFPSLAEELLRAAELAPERAVYVVDERHRRAAIGGSGWRSVNLRTTFEKIVKRAGLKVWPRLFHNLRSSRQTELEERFPTHVVCAWLGNSPTIARKHYLQVLPEHFDRAMQLDGSKLPKEGAKAHKTAHAVANLGKLEGTKENPDRKMFYTVGRRSFQPEGKTDAEGFEPPVSFHPRRFSRPVP
jgi:integrase